MQGSKSRREVDPWWEVDLMSTHHIHSISFTISGGSSLYKINDILHILKNALKTPQTAPSF